MDDTELALRALGLAICFILILLPAVYFAVSQDAIRQRRVNKRLRAALAPIIRHADAPDTAPPLRLSVMDCKKIKEMVKNADAR